MRKSINAGIQLQLVLLIVVVFVISVTVFTVETTLNTRNYVTSLRGEKLSVIAQLKASQVSQALGNVYYQVSWISSRSTVQHALMRYRAGNHSDSNWAQTNEFFNATLGTYSVVMGATIYDPSCTEVFSVTNSTITNLSALNSTLFPLSTKQIPESLRDEGITLAGPSPVDLNLMSVTFPVYSNTTLLQTQITVGYVTLLLSSQAVRDVVDDTTGMDDSSQLSLIEPVPNFLFHGGYTQFRYIFPPGQGSSNVAPNDAVFNVQDYPAVAQSLDPHVGHGTVDNTRTPYNDSVAVGFCNVTTRYSIWAVLIEQPSSVIASPIATLKRIIAGLSVGLAVLIILLTVIFSYYGVQPIYRLRDAALETKLEFHNLEPFRKGEALAQADKTRQPFQKAPFRYVWEDLKTWFNLKEYDPTKGMRRKRKDVEIGGPTQFVSENGVIKKVEPGQEEKGVVVYTAPSHVHIPKRWFRDELTALTEVFNRLADELTRQYASLEDMVIDRTKELEAAKVSAEQANEAKTLFIANITHELRTPLNGILGMTAVSMTESDPEKIKKSLQVITTSGELLLHLLNDLLTFSKNQIGLKLDEKEFMFQELIVNLRAMNLGKEKKITVTYEVPAEEISTMVLYGDSTRLLQIMVNLISNAVKFTPRGGKVSLRVKNHGDINAIVPGGSAYGGSTVSGSSSVRAGIIGTIHQNSPNTSNSTLPRKRAGQISSINRNINTLFPEKSLEISRTQSKESRASRRNSLRQIGPLLSQFDLPKDLLFEIEVEDNGPGVPDGLKQRIFEPFVQGDQALSRKHGGTGLGLSICKQLTELMGGKIILQDTAGGGATFIVQIPLKMTRAVAASPSVAHEEGVHSHGNSRRQSLSAPSTNPDSSVASPSTEVPSAQLDRSGSVHSITNPLHQDYFGLNATSLRIGDSARGIVDRGEHIRVLVAEDNVVNQEIMKRMLRLEGVHNITIAEDGEAVVKKVEQAIKDGYYYDILFMDIQMPKLNGLEAARFMRGTLGYPYTIIAMTAYADKQKETECIEAGLNGVTSKPILRAALRKILDDYCPGAPLHEPAVAPLPSS